MCWNVSNLRKTEHHTMCRKHSPITLHTKLTLSISITKLITMLRLETLARRIFEAGQEWQSESEDMLQQWIITIYSNTMQTLKLASRTSDKHGGLQNPHTVGSGLDGGQFTIVSSTLSPPPPPTPYTASVPINKQVSQC